MFKRISHVPRNVNGLHFQCAKIINLACLVVSANDDVNITSRTAVGVF